MFLGMVSEGYSELSEMLLGDKFSTCPGAIIEKGWKGGRFLT